MHRHRVHVRPSIHHDRHFLKRLLGARARIFDFDFASIPSLCSFVSSSIRPMGGSKYLGKKLWTRLVSGRKMGESNIGSTREGGEKGFGRINLEKASIGKVDLFRFFFLWNILVKGFLKFRRFIWIYEFVWISVLYWIYFLKILEKDIGS